MKLTAEKRDTIVAILARSVADEYQADAIVTAIESVIAAASEPQPHMDGASLKADLGTMRQEIAKRDAELAALREKLADEKQLHDQTRGWLRDEKAKVATVERELAELRAAVDKYSMQSRHTTDGAFVYGRGWHVLGEGKTFSAACLAAYRAENAEVPNG